MKKGSQQSPEALERMRAAARAWWADPENRAKSMGRSPSAETREKMRQAKLANPTNYWKGKKRGPQSEEWRARISAANSGKQKPEGFGERIGAPRRGIPRSPEVIAKMRAGLAKPEAKAAMRASVLGKPCRHAKHPVFYKGIRMRSTYETRVAAAFDALGMPWQYEPRRFDLGGETYLPDFYLPSEAVYVEVKGWYGPNSARKCSKFYEQYPDVTLAILMRDQVVELEQLAATTRGLAARH